MDDIFQPVETVAPPPMFSTRSDHPVPRLGITQQQAPIGTNKFYANFFLGSQTASTWTHPYSVSWAKGGGASKSWGMSVSHIDENQKVFGPDPNASTAQYFINPIGIQSIVLSALDLGPSTSISIDSITAFAAKVNILPRPGASSTISFPLVQGMAFVTGIYYGATPIVQTGVFFRSIVKSNVPRRGVTKYVMNLEDGKTWLLYAYSPLGDAFELTPVSNSLAQATTGFNGTIQIAKLGQRDGGTEQLYDRCCGAYAKGINLSGLTSGSMGSYSLSFEKGGLTDTILAIFALTHHIESFSSTTRPYITKVQLNTTTKGVATIVVADTWTIVEKLPTDMGFAPWNGSSGNKQIGSAATISAIHDVAGREILQDMEQQTNLNSMYFSGKV